MKDCRSLWKVCSGDVVVMGKKPSAGKSRIKRGDKK